MSQPKKKDHYAAVLRVVALLLLSSTLNCTGPALVDKNAALSSSSRNFSGDPSTDSQALSPREMVLLAGGSFTMGDDNQMPYEAPTHRVEVNGFWIDVHEVTTAQFEAFVKATGYKTDAEKVGWSGVFDVKSGEWRRIDGADWRHPDGPSSSTSPDEPATQVSWNDARAYAEWAGKRLPTEAEWEYAARGGLESQTYAWGQELHPSGKFMANTWQGKFPAHDTGLDGYTSRAPVGKFPPNGYGLYDMIGNVWEWATDWFDETYYQHSPSVDPKGPDSGTERAIRGGSWLCSDNYCSNYRPSARSHATPDSGLNNLGFRCVKDKK